MTGLVALVLAGVLSTAGSLRLSARLAPRSSASFLLGVYVLAWAQLVAVRLGGVPAGRRALLRVPRTALAARAGDRARTGDIQLGRLTLYQLSYTRAGLA